MLKKMENKVGALHLTLLTFMELVVHDEKFWGTAKACQDFPQSITADSVKGHPKVAQILRNDIPEVNILTKSRLS